MLKKVILLIIVAGIVIAWIISKSVYHDNIKGNEDIVIYIPSDADYKEVKQVLSDKNVLKKMSTFEIVAEKMKYPALVKPGKYTIGHKLNNRDLLVMLRRGDQTPVSLVIHNERTIENLCGKISKYLEGDSLSFLEYFKDEKQLSKYGYNTDNIMTAFIPNTYNILWNTSPEQFLERMLHEKGRFWTNSRLDKARKIGLSVDDIFILASIVEQELSNQSEASRIAGVYLNRLHKNMLLQADPTLKFAHRDFGLRRILNKHKEIDSPYNTYKYKGLTPGPICLPSIKTIDATLNVEQHDYLYFCAKADYSGFHQFSKTYSEHLRYAREYQSTLNRDKIFK